MKLEKRSEGGPVEPVEEETPKGKKPVVVYIMILFIAAFLLMAWSFASHQRSNTEAMGRLQSSVGAMREVQDLQDQVIALQQELAEAEDTIEDQEKQSAENETHIEQLQSQIEGMSLLYTLQQCYSAGDLTACRACIDEFEGGGYQALLPQLSGRNVTQPAERYRQLKEAVEAREALETQTAPTEP